MKKKWDQEKVDAFLKFTTEKFKNPGSHIKSEHHGKYLAIFLHLLENENFKQKLPKCSKHSKVSLVLESLLDAKLTSDELLLLGKSLCKNLFYSDLLAQLILVLFEKHLTENERVLDFLRTVWFDKDIICDLPSTWTLYLHHWPQHLETHVLNILQSMKSTLPDQLESSQTISNIWNQFDNHFLIKMCCKSDHLFQAVCQILQAMLSHSGCGKVMLNFIRLFIISVGEYCVQNNSDIVDLYPMSVQSVVLCCTLNMYSNVHQYVDKIPADWKFILSTHYPRLASILLQIS
ncbi:hypothetical protein M8J75_016647 [Diaphorina citri]|nr:hypothetical protein M8J75_016647 [Diaphorina citri]